MMRKNHFKQELLLWPQVLFKKNSFVAKYWKIDFSISVVTEDEWRERERDGGWQKLASNVAFLTT